MLELQISQEASLVEPLEFALDGGPYPTVDDVLDCAIAAARFNLGALLCMCEILLMSELVRDHMFKDMEKLPCSSLLKLLGITAFMEMLATWKSSVQLWLKST